MTADRTLLAHLAPRLTQSTENTAVEALGYILSQSAAARDALRDVLRDGGADVGPIARVKTQASDEKGRRPDLVGFDEHGAERVLIEAKFWAGLQSGQPNAYLDRLAPRDSVGPSALLFVAPQARFETLWAELRRRAQGKFELSEAPERQSAAIVGSERRLMLTSWEDLLGPMAVRASAAGDSAVALDIRQLLGLTTRMDEEAFLPLRSDELAPEFPRRMRGLQRLINDATARGHEAGWVSTEGLNVSPQWHGYGRYLLLFGAGAWFGVNFDLWAQHADSPLWLSFYEFKRHKSVVSLDEIRRALLLSSDENYVPIHLPVGVEYDAVLDNVVAQLERIGQKINHAYQRRQTR